MSDAEETTALDPFASAWALDRRVAAGGREVRFREAGVGAVIVLVHGLGMSADYWRNNGPPLARAGYRVIAPDFPGFGETDGPTGGLSVRRQAASLEDFLDALGLSDVVLVGHSLSCQSIIELAVEHPARAVALVLAAPTGDPRSYRLWRQAIGLIRDVHRESLALVAEVTRAYFRAGPLRVWLTWRMGGRHEPIELAPRVAVPALIVVGERDPVVPPEFAEALARAFRRGELRFLEGAAHALIFTHAVDFNRVMLEFVERVGLMGRAATAEPEIAANGAAGARRAPRREAE